MRIIGIEGMGDFPVIQHQLLEPMLEKYPGKFQAIFMAWNDPRLMATKADIAVGHSLGGHASIEWARKNKPQALITLDARWMDNLSWLDVGIPWRKPFQAPIPNTHNFIHTPNVFFPGYPVVGAKENTYLFTTHMTIPGHPEVFKRLEGLINGKV